MERSRFASRWSAPTLLESVRRHVARHIGPVDAAFQETGPRAVPLSLLHVPPSERRPFHALVTSGIASTPMNGPSGSEPLARAELFLLLRHDWPCARHAWRDPRWGWPARELRRAACAPHGTSTRLECGKTLGEGREPYAPGTGYCAALVVHPVSIPEGFATLFRSEGFVRFYQLIPLYPEELLFASRFSSNALIARFAQLQIDDVIDPRRRNACRLPSDGDDIDPLGDEKRRETRAILHPSTGSFREEGCGSSAPLVPSRR